MPRSRGDTAPIELDTEPSSDPQDSDSSPQTLELKPEDSVYLRQDRLLASPPPMALMARDLSAFFRISAAIGDIRKLDLLKRRLLELIGEVVPAQRGVILLAGESSDEMDSAWGWHRRSGKDQPVPFDHRLVKRVLLESEAVLTRGPIPGEDGAERSILCFPLFNVDRILGAVYLESAASGPVFDEDNLQFLTAISGMISVALENTRNIEWLETENRRLREGADLKHGMVGRSPAMRRLYNFIAKVAPTDSTVLIRGESGTGKELAARAIHLNSPRHGKPFVAINCATLTEPLLESELFGHEKGAFTGALRLKRGKLELVDGGTLMLDELGDLAPSLQAKLLRVLQESEFERVGGTSPIRVNIRLIAATNKSLEQAMESGTFREDLYYRLNVVSINIPPLRERHEDIPALANYFVKKHSSRAGRRVIGISPAVEDVLMAYCWPGNVRELENAIERAVVMGADELIQAEDLPEHIVGEESVRSREPIAFHDAVQGFKRDFLAKTLKRAGGNYTRAAKRLGLHPNYLHRLVNKLELREEVDKARASD